MPLALKIALRHLLARKRQSFVSIIGIVLGTAFFLAVASMMQGSEKDFISRLVDNSPHITISDEFRNPREQPAKTRWKDGAIEIKNVKPVNENRGVRGHEQIVSYLRTLPGVKAAPVLSGSALVNFAGQDISISLNGMNPQDITDVTTIKNYMTQGTVNSLISNPDGIVIGQGLARRLSVDFGDNLTVTASTGQVRTFKVLGLFSTGRSNYDNRQAYIDLKRMQAMLDRPNRANTIIVKIPDPYSASEVAKLIEARVKYKSESWQEESEDLLKTLVIRNAIMYTVVSAVLIVAAFGIYNVISTVVMEKQRDIAILKSIGFHASDIRAAFLIQGIILGLIGSALGIPIGCGIMLGLMNISFKPPGSSEIINMPLDWSWPQFAIAAGFAIFAATLAAFLPARKGAKVHPVDILRGGA